MAARTGPSRWASLEISEVMHTQLFVWLSPFRRPCRAVHCPGANAASLRFGSRMEWRCRRLTSSGLPARRSARHAPVRKPSPAFQRWRAHLRHRVRPESGRQDSVDDRRPSRHALAIVKEIPARVCHSCMKQFHDEDVSDALRQLIESKARWNEGMRTGGMTVRALALAVVMVSVSVLAACGGGSSVPAQSGETAAATAAPGRTPVASAPEPGEPKTVADLFPRRSRQRTGDE